MALIKLLAGLGNPGDKYRLTRHNFGFMLLNELARRAGQNYAMGKGSWLETRLQIAGSQLRAIKPQTYMNLSGQAVRQCSAYYRIEPEEILVVCDDINLPLGQMRIRPAGSAGGHNGLKDIIAELGTDRFSRLRLGVGLQPEKLPSEVFVLQAFDDNETELVEKTIDTAAEAVAFLIREGLEAAQNKYN